jgi:multiple sugar transport system permease protein
MKARLPWAVAAVNLSLLGGTAMTLFPLVWMVYASFLPDTEATAFPPRFSPDRLTLAHYRALFAQLDLAR